MLLDPGALIVAMRSDKKTRDGSPRFVLVEELGTVRWDSGAVYVVLLSLCCLVLGRMLDRERIEVLREERS